MSKVPALFLHFLQRSSVKQVYMQHNIIEYCKGLFCPWFSLIATNTYKSILPVKSHGPATV